tara:strand:+ start:577 stop:936 length:360 start_codon:yes stop_codon:yes gene_type:complete
MAHFAELDVFKKVVRVLAVDNKDTQDVSANEVESVGAKYLHDGLGGTWVQTSYNNNFRKNYAGRGDTYDETRDAFIPPKPYPSWVLNEDTCQWNAPTALPDEDRQYNWNEDTTSWENPK